MKNQFKNKIAKFVSEIGTILVSRSEQIAVAESCTGGMLGCFLTALPGSSKWFAGGVIAYSNNIKENIIGVPKYILKKYGAVSRQTARAMVRGITKLMDTKNGIAITGIAGPAGGTKKKPVGTVWIAVQSKLRYKEKKFKFYGGREKIREAAVLSALKMAHDSIK